MILWFPRLSWDGRFVVGYRPQPGERSEVVLFNRLTGDEQVLDPNGTQPVWAGSVVLVRPQTAEAALRVYRPDGTFVETIALPAPPNGLEADDDGRWAAYLGPPAGPRIVGGQWPDPAHFMPTGAYTSPAPAGTDWLATRHHDGALVVWPAGRLDPVLRSSLPHRLVRPARNPAGDWVALVYVGQSWLVSLGGTVYAALGRAYDIMARDGYVAIAREPGDIVVCRLTQPTLGWVVPAASAAAIDLAQRDGTLVVAWCTPEGVYHETAISLQTPMTDIRVAAPPPPVETWAPTTDLIDLWPLWIGSSGSQYPRRHPDDPGIYWDAQVTALSPTTGVATYVKTTDGRVWERRATWTDGAGRAWIGLIEDHEEDGRIYHFADPRLMPRFARAGQVWTWATFLREWDHTKAAWGPWGPFRFRVRLATVERSSFGRLRAIIEVDTYEDLEIFELLSNKGWSSWEWWRAKAAETSARTRTLPEGQRVGFVQRTEWPERYDGPRPWPAAPKTTWPAPDGVTLPPVEPTRITISEPADWPVTVPAGGALRVVYAVTAGPEPFRIRWWLNDQAVATNPGWDYDHTYRDLVPGRHRVHVEALDASGAVLDRTGRVREIIVPAPQPEPTPDPGSDIPPSWTIYANFLANGIEPWGFMAPSWYLVDRARWERFVRAYRAAGYRHLPFALYGAYAQERAFDVRSSPDRARELVEAHLAVGITPILMVVTDEPDGSVQMPDQAWNRVRPALEAIRDLPIVWCTGWEINQIPGWREDRNPRQGHDLIQLCQRIRQLTGQAPWVHFAPNWWGPHYTDGDEDRWWRDVGDACAGLLGQIRPDAPLALTGDDQAPDGLYLWLRYPRADGARGIVGRLQARGKPVVLFEHSRDLARWMRVRAILQAEPVAGIG